MASSSNNNNNGNQAEKRTAVEHTGSKPNATGNERGSERNAEQQVRWYKRPFVRKLSYAILSALIAMMLWGYVLMSENPARERRVENVSVSFATGSESDLDAKRLTVCGNIEDILPQVTVTVETTLNDLPRFNHERNIVRATVSVSDVKSAGEYTLDITAVTSIGRVVAVSPSTVTINFDNLLDRNIPVSYSFIGELPEGYWHNAPQLLRSSIDIKGAESEIINIVKANCEIDLTGRTRSVNDSFTLQLYDKDNNIIDSSVIVSSVPSVTVLMDILPFAELSVEPKLVGQDILNDIFEVTNVSIEPKTLGIAADAETLAAMNGTLSTIPIDISDINEEGTSIRYDITVEGLPDGVTLLSKNQFTVTVEIRERYEEKEFKSVPIVIENENKTLYGYSYDVLTCDITLRGKASVIRSLSSWDITLKLNMSGYGSGKYTLTPELELPDPNLFIELTYEITPVVCEILLKQ